MKKINSHPYAKYLKPLAALLALYASYHLYLWSITQTTDNAYVDADISYVGAEVSGTISTVHIGDNILVKKGDVIAKVDDTIYKANQQKAEANVVTSKAAIEITKQKIELEQINNEKTKSALELAKINFDLAKVDYQRTQELVKDNFSSKKLLDVSRAAFEKAKNDYNQAQLALSSSNHNLSLLDSQKIVDESNLQAREQEKILADQDLLKTSLIAPVEGTMTSSNVKIGSYVRPGLIIFAIVPNKQIYIKANFKETQVKKFKPGMKVQITVDAASSQEIYGTIRNISPATGSKFSLIPPDNATGNFTKVVQRVPVLIDFEVPDNVNIVPGMSAIVSVRL
jgi:membrane fusion protein (multidrug efflux system)